MYTAVGIPREGKGGARLTRFGNWNNRSRDFPWVYSISTTPNLGLSHVHDAVRALRENIVTSMSELLQESRSRSALKTVFWNPSRILFILPSSTGHYPPGRTRSLRSRIDLRSAAASALAWKHAAGIGTSCLRSVGSRSYQAPC